MTARWVVCAALLLSHAGAAAGQQGPVHRAESVPWPLLDLTLLSDSATGVGLLAAPSLLSDQGDFDRSNEFTLDPAAALEWAASARAALTTLADTGSANMRALVPMLVGRTEGTGLGLARQGHGNGLRFVLIIRDTRSNGWRVEGRRTHVDSLLAILERVARASRVVPDSARGESHTMGGCPDDKPPERLSGPAPHYPPEMRRRGIPGRVWFEFVIDTTGSVDTSSVAILLSTHPDFAAAAVRAVHGTRYQPGVVCGKPVRVLVRQPVSFQISR